MPLFLDKPSGFARKKIGDDWILEAHAPPSMLLSRNSDD